MHNNKLLLSSKTIGSSLALHLAGFGQSADSARVRARSGQLRAASTRAALERPCALVRKGRVASGQLASTAAGAGTWVCLGTLLLHKGRDCARPAWPNTAVVGLALLLIEEDLLADVHLRLGVRVLRLVN